MNVSTEFSTIAPHGGELVDRRAPEEQREELLSRAEGFARVTLGPRALSDLEMLSTGVFSPLPGFMVSEDYESVVETMHLKDGLAWSLPITLPASEEEANGIRVGEEISLTDEAGRVLATMIVEDRYSYDKEHEAREVYGTTNPEHPGVAAVYRQKDVLLGGEVTLLVDDPNPKPFPTYHYEPRRLREVFAEKGWKRVVGFQTRNPVHRSHEYIQKSALEIVDGLLLNPLVGETRSADIPADVRMRSYETILRALLSQGPDDAGRLPRGDALRRTPRGDLPRDLPQELRLHTLHRRPRPRRTRQGLQRQAVLRRLRRPTHLR